MKTKDAGLSYGPYVAAKRVIESTEPPKPVYPPMADVLGPHIPITIVSAKCRGHWIIRGWCPFQEPVAVQAEVAKFTTDAEGPIEWTTHTYDVPAYLIYGSRFAGGELDGWGWPVGIYRFLFNGDPKTLDSEFPHDTYRGEIECLREGFVRGSWATE